MIVRRKILFHPGYCGLARMFRCIVKQTSDEGGVPFSWRGFIRSKDTQVCDHQLYASGSRRTYGLSYRRALTSVDIGSQDGLVSCAGNHSEQGWPTGWVERRYDCRFRRLVHQWPLRKWPMWSILSRICGVRIEDDRQGSLRID